MQPSYDDSPELRQRIEALAGRRVRGPVPVFEDSSDDLAIRGGSVLRLPSGDFYVIGCATEGRFGLDEQPKIWVKRAVELATGARKIIKLVFEEEFVARIAGAQVRCRRSHRKESAVLAAVRGHPRFMQGVTVADARGAPVRVIDHIPGGSLYDQVAERDLPHERYYHEVLPRTMRELIPCVEALAELHALGLHHGDVRNDHILVEAGTGIFRWIDFDYEVSLLDHDAWHVGNVLNHVVSQGRNTFHEVARDPARFPLLAQPLDEGDALLLLPYRIANLHKLFPYIDPALGELLRAFSVAGLAQRRDLAHVIQTLRQVFAPATPPTALTRG